MDRMIAGQANKVIAIELEISQRTVKSTVPVMHKMEHIPLHIGAYGSVRKGPYRLSRLWSSCQNVYNRPRLYD